MLQKLTSKLKQITWFEHGLAILLFTLLTLLVTWPTIRDINQLLISDGGDARHYLAHFWHIKEWVIGNQPLFDLPLLYYPIGASMLTHSTGPVVALFGLPFWVFGPEVAYNSVYLIGFILTGFCMYLFARGVGFDYQVAIFCGITLMMAPLCVMGFYGHISKIFLGDLVLLFLALHHTYQLNRTRWWAVITGFVFLFILLTNGTHFAIGALSAAIFSTIVLISATSLTERWILLQRGVLAAVSSLILIAPLLYLILEAADHPLINVDVSKASVNYQPDLVQFLLPNPESLLLGNVTRSILVNYDGVIFGIETLIALSWTAILLCFVAFIYGSKIARQYIGLLLCLLILSLGPYLKVLGQTEFSSYNLSLILPYSFVTAIPGFDFLRTPARFMFVGFAIFSLVAGYGLTYLITHWPKQRYLIILFITLLILVEYWPRSFPQEKLLTTPEFYQQLAYDTDLYGVFDVPIKNENESSTAFSANFQMYQMTHRKGIASGYISRTYTRHPFLPDLMQLWTTPQDLLINGKPGPTKDIVLYKLNQHNYRYVVLHKPLLDSSNETPTHVLLDGLFADQLPLVDDNLSTVYEVPPVVSNTLLIYYDAHHWQKINTIIRLAISPAKLHIISPSNQPAHLELTPVYFYGSNPIDNNALKDVDFNELYQSASLELQTIDGSIEKTDLIVGKMASLPLNLVKGQQAITLTVKPMHHQTNTLNKTSDTNLTFALQSVNLVVGNNLKEQDVVRVSGEPLNANFDDKIMLLGYQLFKTNSGYKVALYWQTLIASPTSYKQFIHLTTLDGSLIAQTDNFPTGDNFPTTHWPLDEPVVGEHHLMVNQLDPNKTYQITIGLYNPETLERLPILNQPDDVTASQVVLTTLNDF